MRSALPSRSPTTVFNWHSATRTTATGPDYRPMSDVLEVARAEEAVRTASRSLGRLLDSDPDAVGVLHHLHQRATIDTGSVDALVRSKKREFLRIAARDLLALDRFEATAAALSTLAADIFEGA